MVLETHCRPRSAWTAIVMLLDLVVVAGALQRSLEMFKSVPGTWLPFVLIFLRRGRLASRYR